MTPEQYTAIGDLASQCVSSAITLSSLIVLILAPAVMLAAIYDIIKRARQ